MDNQQQYYPQPSFQQMPPVKKTKPLYKKWWFWTFMVCNTFVIGILFLTVVATVDENLKYKAVLEEANEKISQLESQLSNQEEFEKRFGDIKLTDTEIKEIVDKILPDNPEMDEFSAKRIFFTEKEQEWKNARKQILFSTPLHSKTVDRKLFLDFCNKSIELIEAFYSMSEHSMRSISEEHGDSYSDIVKKKMQNFSNSVENYIIDDNIPNSLIKIEQYVMDEIHFKLFPKHFEE